MSSFMTSLAKQCRLHSHLPWKRRRNFGYTSRNRQQHLFAVRLWKELRPISLCCCCKMYLNFSTYILVLFHTRLIQVLPKAQRLWESLDTAVQQCTTLVPHLKLYLISFLFLFRCALTSVRLLPAFATQRYNKGQNQAGVGMRLWGGF